MRRLIALFVCAASLHAHAATHTITGSRTMFQLNVALSERYARIHPGTQFAVAQDGTSKGIEFLLQGRTDVAAVTRPLRPEEKKQFQAKGKPEPVEYDLAVEGISIYLHPRNPVNTLSVDQLRRIFAGEITDWKAVGGAPGPIHVYSFDNTTGRHWYVVENLLQKKSFTPATRFTSSSATVPTADLADQQKQMLELVAGDPAGIGYGDLKKVRLVKIARVATNGAAYWPTPDDLQARRYPLARRLILLLPAKADAAVVDFAHWASQQEDLIRAFDFVPLK